MKDELKQDSILKVFYSSFYKHNLLNQALKTKEREKRDFYNMPNSQ